MPRSTGEKLPQPLLLVVAFLHSNRSLTYYRCILTKLLQTNLKTADKGWLNERAVNSIDATTTATPGSLFNTPNRPLLVAFFGGTGVGKSTLLNRFAGQPIARVGVQRPTSSEITMYFHESITVARLPDEFPKRRLRAKTHQNNQYRSTVWIDMPDFDSVEQSNRELVKHWLPHIDVIVYVVSPDRYRDDNGWRLLLEHGTQHAWLFVINHWDRGDERQREDFRQMLKTAGLAKPILFCTDCSDAKRNSRKKTRDEFEQFRETINSLADQQLIEQLESRGVVQRIKQIRSVTDALRAQMSSTDQLEQLTPLWQSHWANSTNELVDSVEWKIPNVASLYADQEQGLLSSLYARLRGKQPKLTEPIQTRAGLANLLDDAFFDRVNESVDDFTQQATGMGVAISALQAPLTALKPEWRIRAGNEMETAIQQSIAEPGTKMQRQLHKMLGWLCWLLPLAAMCWAGYRIINVFRLGANDPASYLSTNFAVHSVLLISLAWLVPTFLWIKCKPSREKSAARGARAGLRAVAEQISQQVQGALKSLKQDQQQRLNELDNILSSGVQVDDQDLPEALQRMLIQEPPAVPVAGVRATIQS